MSEIDKPTPDWNDRPEHRQLRRERQRRRAYIRSIYLLPSMATLGNAVCGFAAIYIAGLGFDAALIRSAEFVERVDPLTRFLYDDRFSIAAYFIFAAMIFDALDGRLARFTRHTTDFGGQLDSLADVISFGVAPAMLMLEVCREMILHMPDVPHAVTRAIWAIGAIYASCAAVRLARFNVSNEHGEQHHYSFLGLPSPAAGGAVAALVLLFEAVRANAWELTRSATASDAYVNFTYWLMYAAFWSLPVVTLLVGLLMVSAIRYPHLVNRYLRGRKSLARLVVMMILAGVVLALHKYAIAISMLAYTIWGLVAWAMGRWRSKSGAQSLADA